MTAIELLVLESINSVKEADAEKIRSCVSEMTGEPVSREGISEALESLMSRKMLSSGESDEKAVKKVYKLGQDGKLHFSASSSHS
jgi:hypothetical protein